jgi:hypothetical protein
MTDTMTTRLLEMAKLEPNGDTRGHIPIVSITRLDEVTHQLEIGEDVYFVTDDDLHELIMLFQTARREGMQAYTKA